jgi:hypothetical protein
MVRYLISFTLLILLGIADKISTLHRSFCVRALLLNSVRLPSLLGDGCVPLGSESRPIPAGRFHT